MVQTNLNFKTLKVSQVPKYKKKKTYLISHLEIFLGTDLINRVIELGSNPKYGLAIESLLYSKIYFGK